MTPPDRVSEPVSLSGAPIAASSKPSLQAHAIEPRAARPAGDDDAGHDPHAVDRDRLGARVAQLVDQLLDAGAVDRAARP